MANPRAYVVGGAVRDRLLGLPIKDRDWVVVGSTPEAMRELGYRPVGADFPVFLHPETHEEYALARTERKTAPGYHGFAFHASPEVTLEQDLRRRDLTINAMAEAADGSLVDPWGGAADLAARLLRHVSPAFAEDPVRILRVARFAARFADFTVAPETMALMRSMVEAGEADALVPERVWRELARGLMEARPSRMLEVLRESGALARVLPEVEGRLASGRRVDSAPGIDTTSAIVADAGASVLRAIDDAARRGADLAVRYACLAGDLEAGTASTSERLARTMSDRLRVDTASRELALVVARERGSIGAATSLAADAVVDLLDRCDAWRRPERFADALLACECIAGADPDPDDDAWPPRARLLEALRLAEGVDAARIAADARAAGRTGPAIGAALRAARVEAVRALVP